MSEDNQDDFSLNWETDELEDDEEEPEVLQLESSDDDQPPGTDTSPNDSSVTPRQIEGSPRNQAEAEPDAPSSDETDTYENDNVSETSDEVTYEAMTHLIPELAAQDFMPEPATTTSEHQVTEEELVPPPGDIQTPSYKAASSVDVTAEHTDTIKSRISASSLGELLMKSQDDLVRVRSRLIESERQLKRELVLSTDRAGRLQRLEAELKSADSRVSELQRLLRDEQRKHEETERHVRSIARERDEAVGTLSSERTVYDLKIRRLVEETERLSAAQNQREGALAEQHRLVLSELAAKHQEAATLREELMSCAQELQNEREQRRSLRAELSRLQEKNELTDRELQALRAQLQIVNEAGKRAEAQTRESLAALEESRKLLAKQAADNPEYQKLTKHADLLADQLVASERRNRELESRVQESHNEVLQVREDLARSKRYIQSLERSLSELLPLPADQRSVKTLINENCQLEQAQTNLVAAVKAKDEKIQELSRWYSAKLEGMEAVLSQQNQKISQLEDDRCKKLETELAHSRNRILQLEASEEHKAQAIKSLSDQLARVSEEKEQWKRAVHSAQEERLAAVTERLSQNAEHLYLRGQLDRECNRTQLLTDEVAQLTAGMDRLSEQLKAMKSERDEAFASSHKTEEDNAELMSRCQTIQDQLERLQNLQSSTEEAVTEKQLIITDRNAVLEETINRFETTVVEKHQRLLDMEAEIKKLTSQRDELMRMVEANDARNAGALKAAVEKEHKTLTEKFQEILRRQKNDFKLQADLLETQVLTTKNEMVQLRTENTALGGQKQELQTKCAQLENRNRGTLARLQGAQNEISSLNAQLETANNRIQELEKEMTELKAQAQEQTSKCDTLKAQQDVSQRQLEQLKRANVALRRSMQATPKAAARDERLAKLVESLSREAREDLFEAIKHAAILAMIPVTSPAEEEGEVGSPATDLSVQ